MLFDSIVPLSVERFRVMTESFQISVAHFNTLGIYVKFIFEQPLSYCAMVNTLDYCASFSYLAMFASSLAARAGLNMPQGHCVARALAAFSGVFVPAFISPTMELTRLAETRP